MTFPSNRARASSMSVRVIIAIGLGVTVGVAYACSLIGSRFPKRSPVSSTCRGLLMNTNKTFSPKAVDVERQWWVIDAASMPLGASPPRSPRC